MSSRPSSSRSRSPNAPARAGAERAVTGRVSGGVAFDAGCTACPRLARYLAEVRIRHPEYYARPVPPFGSRSPSILIVGLAPGLHGANRSGRPFTGDHAGLLLYATLHAFGLATRAVSTAATDGLRLPHARITNAVKCVPPANKPLPAEVQRCNGYLATELAQLPSVRVILALGRIAHDAVLRALALPRATHPFTHGGSHRLSGERVLLDSYHCSRYNTQTRRLTPEMFRAVVGRAVELANLAHTGAPKR